MPVSHIIVVDSAYPRVGVRGVTLHTTTDKKIVAICDDEYSESFLRYVESALASYSAQQKYEQSRQEHNAKIAEQKDDAR